VAFARDHSGYVHGLYRRPDAPGPAVVCTLSGTAERIELSGHGFETWLMTHLIGVEDETYDDAEMQGAVDTVRAFLPGDGAPWRVHGAEARTALAAGELPRAQAAAGRMRAAVAADPTGEGLSATLDVEWRVAEAAGDLAGAARALRHRVDLEAHIGDDVRETTALLQRDLGLVEEKAGRHEEAVEALVRAGDLYAELEDPAAVSAFAEAARIAFSAGDLATASRLCGDAVGAGQALALEDESEVMRARTLRARASFADGEPEDALDDLMDASRCRCPDTPAGRRGRADLWLHLGQVSVALAMRHQAAACYATVLALSDVEEAREAARRGLESLGERFEAPLDGFRVVHLPPTGGAHVMHAFVGIYVETDPVREAVGERVRVDYGTSGIAHIRRPGDSRRHARSDERDDEGLDDQRIDDAVV
jgi:tetratricopeptide (TPR) repeat protein